MITVLTIDDNMPKSNLGKMKNLFKRDSITTNVIAIKRLKVLHLVYSKYKDDILWDKIEHITGQEKKTILCNEALALPHNKGFFRYKSQMLMERMAINSALAVLKELHCKHGLNLTLGVYDKDGRYGALLNKFFAYTNKINVISKNKEAYNEVAESIMEECGGCFVFRSSVKSLNECHIIVAPDKITEKFPTDNKTAVFTSVLPSVSINGYVFDNYILELPFLYKTVKPQSISDMYFAQALFDKGEQKELGNIVPNICMWNGADFTIDEIVSLLLAQYKKLDIGCHEVYN